MIFEPLDFIARLAALVPKPRVNLTRFHGVFAPSSKYRSEITPQSKRKRQRMKETAIKKHTPTQKHRSMTWAQRLKRVFGIDIETCHQCGGVVRIIASIENPLVVAKILSHLDKKNKDLDKVNLPESRAPPQFSLLE